LRIDELDSLRATALVMMLVLNFVTDLNHFGIMNTETGDQWWWMARIAASLFVGISGVSYFLAHRLEYDFTKTSGRTKRLIFWAFVITIITYIFEPSAYVRFGVLHLLALASIVAFPVARKPEFALGIGLILLIIPLSSNSNLVWLGLSETVIAVDYFPLNPWLGIFFIGLALASRIYPEGKPLIEIQWPEKWLWFGRNTLTIYVIHQPILIGLLVLTGQVPLEDIL
ncbi:MAG: heparan-alpha-glucosaminide N-acetyltransferase, partial [Candidatus Poseidoniia archaeon]|nr:heparan-alpha-glucosaminide N-acetyltransferase [Candidatus Poseidoniia archaeon]